MSDKDPGETHLHRLVLFSDAVFAIAITLLAIEIHPPEHWSGIGALFALMAPKLAAYAVSFAVIAIYWVSHRRTFTHLLRADFVLDILNFLMLGLLALLPLTTELLWENNGRGDAVLVYVGLVALIGLAHGLTWAYAALLGRLVTPALSLGTRVFILLRVALLPGLMCGLTIVSLATRTPWGFIAMGLIIGGLVLVSRLLNRAAA